MNADMKKCTGCLEEKHLGEFYMKKSSVNGKYYPTPKCKKCHNKLSVEFNNKHRRGNKKFRGYENTYRKKRLLENEEYADRKRVLARAANKRNRPTRMIQAAKERATKKSIEFSIKKEDIIIPDVCPILGIPLIFGDKDNYEQSPSLDRINNSRGYSKDNIQVISKKANSMKNSGTPEELLKMADWIYQTFKLPP